MKYWEIILRIKGAFPMFYVIRNETMQKLQNSNKSLIKKIKQPPSFAFINPIQDGFFGAARGWERRQEGHLPKICHTYPTMTKVDIVTPYPKKIQKTYKLRGTLLDFC